MFSIFLSLSYEKEKSKKNSKEDLFLKRFILSFLNLMNTKYYKNVKTIYQ